MVAIVTKDRQLGQQGTDQKWLWTYNILQWNMPAYFWQIINFLSLMQCRNVNCEGFFSAIWASPLLCRTRSQDGVDQPFDCLIIQNYRAMQSKGRLVWTLEDNIVDED